MFFNICSKNEVQERSHLFGFRHRSNRGIEQAEQATQAIAKLQQTGRRRPRQSRRTRRLDRRMDRRATALGCRVGEGQGPRSLDSQRDGRLLPMQALTAQVAQPTTRWLVHHLRLTDHLRCRGRRRRRDLGGGRGHHRTGLRRSCAALGAGRARPGLWWHGHLGRDLGRNLGRGRRFCGAVRWLTVRCGWGDCRAWLLVALSALDTFHAGLAGLVRPAMAGRVG